MLPRELNSKVLRRLALSIQWTMTRQSPLSICILAEPIHRFLPHSCYTQCSPTTQHHPMKFDVPRTRLRASALNHLSMSSMSSLPSLTILYVCKSDHWYCYCCCFYCTAVCYLVEWVHRPVPLRCLPLLSLPPSSFATIRRHSFAVACFDI